jgi:hypothetical protein
MAKDQPKLADAQSALRDLQRRGRSVFRSDEFSRMHRERLVRQGYLRSAMRGWLLSTSPGTNAGDTTPWFASFWEFIAVYCGDRFAEAWHLAPEPSLLLHVEDWTVPRQLLVHSPKAGNNPIHLPFQSSLLAIKPTRQTHNDEVVERSGLRLLRVEAALARMPESHFTLRPREIRSALATLVDVPRLLQILLESSQPVVAGRLAGALRQVGRTDDADEIVKTMRAAGHDTRETRPFADVRQFTAARVGTSPLVTRVKALWTELREPVLRNFPTPPGRPRDIDAYLAQVDDRYASDAYHSLSIEGYRVSEELIEKVRTGRWDPNGIDRDSRDAMAAKGYAQAFDVVRASVEKILRGANAGAIAEADHRTWYRELFAPSVAAGLLEARDLAGYRREPVFIRASRHVPPRAETLADVMPAFFDLLQTESEPAVSAVLGHWLFGYIHPYRDGNGRMARFLMNAMFAAGGYAWTVIRVEDRSEYLAALDAASVGRDIVPFAKFLGARVLPPG